MPIPTITNRSRLVGRGNASRALQFNDQATALNSPPKYVLSRGLERVTWNNSGLIKGDAVANRYFVRKERVHARLHRLFVDAGSSGVKSWSRLVPA